jgi:anthranilate phosphoribosyltransferase|tara:strand:+ start:27486 stop:28529 length:1044 start_codon:yes stop_codon:yes gene_type:complete
MDLETATARIINGQDLTADEMKSVMRPIMHGNAKDAQISAFLKALSVKNETVEEIKGAVQIMRELVIPVNVNSLDVLDIVGTGGDGANLFNISTATSFVVAAAGVKVAKHGNRSVSSSTGAADVLEAAGVNINLSPKQVGLCVEKVGIGFMFAPVHHPAMRYAVAARKALGLRTIFNILGPMTNPAGSKRQLIGVYSRELCAPVAKVLGDLGAQRLMVVHSRDGLDEISIVEDTEVVEFHDGKTFKYTIKPEEFGLKHASLAGLSVKSPEESVKIIMDCFEEQEQEHQYSEAARDIIVINAGAALYLSESVKNIADGVALAKETISSGLASAKIAQLIDFTLRLKTN